MGYLFQNDDIGIRRMEDNMEDYKLMAKWLSTDEVLDYYEGRSNKFDLEKVIKKFAPRVKGQEAVIPCLIEYRQRAIGYIQYYPIEPNEYDIGDTINMNNYSLPYGMDLFIGETDTWNIGIGTKAVKSMISYLFMNKIADIIFIDPQTWNKRAIRCYEKSGFTPRVVIKNREMHDGEYKDNLIMSISLDAWKTNCKHNNTNPKQIYLAGGCFWGTEKYFSLVKGILSTEVGYANGNIENPTYEDVCYRQTGHAETVKLTYNPEEISLKFILSLYYEVIDPTSKNRQGNDIGVQYRTGIYYLENEDKEIIEASLVELQKKYSRPIQIEVMPIHNFHSAEEYHQKYLDKNPKGYCHIGLDKFEKAENAYDLSVQYKPKAKEVLKNTLTEMQYNVTQNNKTEPPFRNEYFDNFREGIYVDITTGEPLFVSSDKFESGCGWPSFSRPISQDLLKEIEDNTLGMRRIEVRSKNGDAHLGHVFNDGSRTTGGLRYCINSASLNFIPSEEMEEKGYGYLIDLLRKKI